MLLDDLLPMDVELSPTYDWQLQIANDLELANSDDPQEHLRWANTAVALDLFTLGSPLGWTPDMTREERFDALEAHFRDELTGYVQILRQEVLDGARDPVGNFRKRVQGSMRRHYYDAYVLGRQKTNPYYTGMSAADLERVRGIIDKEHTYLRDFCATLREKVKAGQPLPGNIAWRLDLYGKSLRQAYQTGIADGAERDDSITISKGPVKEDHCSTCPPRWGTYTREQYEALDPPPQSWCEGLSNCKCIVTVNYATPPKLRWIQSLSLTLGEMEELEPPLPMAGWRGKEKPVG